MYRGQKGPKRQLTFLDNYFLNIPYDKSHPIIKIADSIDWDELCDGLARFFCRDNGRPTKLTRGKVGLLILKHLEKASDEVVVDRLKRDLYYQYLCDLNLAEAQDFITPSVLTQFRNQIGLEGVNIIEEVIRKVLDKPPGGKKRGPKSKDVVIDTSVTASPVKYPTDIDLLETCRKKCLDGIKKARDTGLVQKKFRTYSRTARKDYLLHQKLGRKSKKQRRKMQKKMIRYVRRNLGQLEECIREIGSQGSLNKDHKKLLESLEDTRNKIAKILEQQKVLASDRKVKDRIVSFHNPKVRPIVRGKYPVSVEFGKKNLFVEKDGYLHLVSSHYDNVSDQHLVEPSLKYCEDTFGETPVGLGADRGFDCGKNHSLCKDRGLKRIGIQKKGKKKKRKKEPWEERLRRRRCGIEGHISVGKRFYGLDRAEYRIDDGEEMWVRLGLSVMNLKKAVNM